MGADLYESYCGSILATSYIITYVVGDCCGVSRVVFGDSRFDFPDEVCSYVGCFGVNTAADTCEEGLCRCDECHI